MAQEDSRKDPLQALSASGEAAGPSAPPSSPVSDPNTEPTISSLRVGGAFTFTQPTRVDPDAPIHQGAAPVSNISRSGGANHTALPMGHQLHEFTIEAVLGSGGFGITYLARDNNLQCRVAIKEYLPNDLAVRMAGQTVCPRADSDTDGYRVGLDRFLSESRVLAGFRHPNIVRVTRFFEANNTAYMVMDYEKGQPLREWLKSHGPVDEKQLLGMFVPLLEGLEVVHKAGVLHRDIKPANIYVREGDGSLVLLDFGAARQASGGTSRSLTSIVTPGYAPFEQYHTHGAQGPWSDLYAFGGVLYWLVTGQKPLESPSRVRNDTMPAASTLAAGHYGKKLLAAIDWALSPDESLRPKTVAEFKAVLTGQASIPVAAAAAAPQSGPAARSPALRYGIAGAAVAAVAVLAFIFYPKPGAPPVAPAPQAGADASDATPANPPPAAPSAEQKKGNTAAVAASAKPEKGKEKGSKPDAAAKAATTGSMEVAQGVPVAYLVFDVTPGGEVYVDGKKAGNVPSLDKLKVGMGKHEVEVRGSLPPYIFYYSVDLSPNENKRVWAKFANTNF